MRNISGITFHQSYCTGIDAANSKIECEDSDTGKKYALGFDILVIAVGEVTNTYGIKGVNENALFLKELSDARKIRTKVVDCFENASLPGISHQERKDFLRFAVCGGGPTGVEFAAELHDFIEEDVKRKYRDLAAYVEIILIEAGNSILASFDRKLSEYTTKIFKRQNIVIKTNSPVKEVDEKLIYLDNDTSFKYGLLVWAAGNTSTNLVRKVGFNLDRRGKILTDSYFRVRSGDKVNENVFAIGDCSAIKGYEIPATAQAAQKTGVFLAGYLNKNFYSERPFNFKNLGMLAYIGKRKALADLPQYKGTGFGAFLFWRSAYLTRLVSFKNKVLVIFDWIKTFVSGRDVSNF
ncbi:MAG: FAD-dependent oxidoreductase [Ignavibacteria bacterium]